VYGVFYGSNMLGRMVDDLGQSVGNVETSISRHSSTKKIVEAEGCENNFPFGGA